MEKLLRDYIVAALIFEGHLGEEDVPPVAKELLLKIDNGPYHALPVTELSDEDGELDVADALVGKGWLRRVPASKRFPEHFVLTSLGSHAIGTFKFSRLR